MKSKLFLILIVVFCSCDKKDRKATCEAVNYEIYLNGQKYNAWWYNITKGNRQINFEATDSFSHFEVLFNLDHQYPVPTIRYNPGNENEYFSALPGKMIIASSGNESNFTGIFTGTLSNGTDTINIRGFLKWQKN